MHLENVERLRSGDPSAAAAEANLNRLERQQPPSDRAAPADATRATDAAGATGNWAQRTEREVRLGIESLRDVAAIRPEQWKRLNPSQRLDALRAVEARPADAQNRLPVREIVTGRLKGNEFGYFDRDHGRIVINVDHLAGAQPVPECADIIIHEGRHAYQWYAVTHPGFAPAELTRDWAYNFENYTQFNDDPEESSAQPIEADASDYAARVRAGIYGAY